MSGGEWWEYDELVRRVAPLIPPAQAVRRAKSIRVRRGINPNTQDQRSLDPALIGARHLIYEALKNGQRNESFELDGTLWRYLR